MDEDAINCIPLELRNLSQWATWRKLPNGDKLPLSYNGGEYRSNDSSTWGTFDQVKNLDLIAFTFSESDPYCGIDLDDAIDADVNWHPWAQEILNKFLGVAYGEISPSGTGIKLITKAKKPEHSRCKHRFFGKQAVECYDNRRFWTITAQVCQGFESIGDGQESLDWLIEKYLASATGNLEFLPSHLQLNDSEKLKRASAYLAAMPPAVAGQSGHNATYSAATALVHGFELSQSDAFRLLASEYNPRCEPPWSEKELVHKIKSAANQPHSKPRGWLLSESQSVGVDLSCIVDPKPPLKTCKASSILSEYVAELLDHRYDSLVAQKEALHGIEIGPGLLTVIGAPPGAGKTALAMQVVYDGIELDDSLRVYVANAETTYKGLLRREFARRTGISSNRIRFGRLSLSHLEEIQKLASELQGTMERIEVVDNCTLAGLLELFDQPPGLLVVDYLQKFAPTDKDVRQGVNEVVNTLRALAKRDWAILALSATKRDGKGKHSSDSLDLASFKESGEIEFNADSAYVLARMDDDDGPIRKMLLKHVKNRHGIPKDHELLFELAKQQFLPSVNISAIADFNEFAGNYFDEEEVL